MNNSQLDRVIRLVKKTNDTFLVLDRASDLVTAILPIDRYERLIDGEGGKAPSPTSPDDFPPVLDSSEPLDIEPQTGYDAKEAAEALEQLEAEDEVGAHGEIPATVSKEKLDFSDNWAAENKAVVSEEDLSDVPEEEEKFYLEPVE